MVNRKINILNEKEDFPTTKNFEKSCLKTIDSINKILNNEKISYKVIDNNLVILNIKDSEKLSESELEDLILDKIIFIENQGIKIKNIDLSRVAKIEKNNINKNDIKNTKKNINNILSKNFPILSVSRIKNGHNIINIRFLGIKKINDNISKEFTDFLINSIEEILEKNFREKNKEITPNWNRGRKISGDYKNISFSLPNDFNVAYDLFKEEKIESFIEKVIESLDSKKIDELLKNNNLKNIEGKNDKEKAIAFIKKHFYIGIGKDKYIYEKNDEKNDVLEKKIESIYKTIFSSKERIKGNINDGINNYDFKKVKEYSEEIIKIKNSLIKTYSNRNEPGKYYFSYDNGEKLSIIVDINGEEHINEILINRIKKDEEINFIPKEIGNDIYNKISKYNKIGNDGFYFLIPKLEEKNSENSYKKLNNSIKKLIIPKNNIIKNQKGFYTKKYIDKLSNNKKGTKIFIDIIGNGLLNFENFINVAEKINDKDNFEINKDNIEQLLHICDNASLKVTNSINDIFKNIPKAIISIAGDEIFIFIPGEEEESKNNNIISLISQNLSSNNLKARIIKSNSNDISFDNLDFLTYINKKFEKKIENTKFGLNKNIILNIDDELKKEILSIKTKENIELLGNININKLLEKIDSKSFINFVKDKDNTKIEYNIYGINVEIIKNINLNIFEINISKI